MHAPSVAGLNSSLKLATVAYGSQLAVWLELTAVHGSRARLGPTAG
jgi:hypothetical protein